MHKTVKQYQHNIIETPRLPFSSVTCYHQIIHYLLRVCHVNKFEFMQQYLEYYGLIFFLMHK